MCRPRLAYLPQKGGGSEGRIGTEADAPQAYRAGGGPGGCSGIAQGLLTVHINPEFLLHVSRGAGHLHPPPRRPRK
jgi:hypothetical protein